MNTGRNAIVTGGIRGLGLEIVKSLLRTDLEKLCITDLVEHKITLKMLRDDYPDRNIIYQHCDVTKKEDVDRCYKETLSKFKHLDIIVNNAGTMDDSNLEQTFFTNLGGVIHSSLLGMNYMSKDNGGKGGYVINISSTGGLGPIYFMPIYSASKTGVVGFTRSMGINDFYYNKTGVKFMVVCPGVSLTNMNNNMVAEKFIFKYLKDVFDREVIAKAVYQDAATTGKCVLKALETGRNGSVFICDHDKIKEVDLLELAQDLVMKNFKS